MNKKIFVDCNGKLSNQNQIIESFPEVIKSLLIDEMNSDINAESFSTGINPERDSWICSAYIENTTSMELLCELSRESASILTADSKNRAKIIPLEVNQTEKVIKIEDILENNFGMPEITITRTGEYDVYNSFTIEYFHDFLSNSFIKYDFISYDGSSLSSVENTKGNITCTDLCINSYNRHKTRNQLNIKAKFIRQRDTAIKLLKWFTEWYSAARYIVEIKCMMNSNTIELEIGDQIKIELSSAPQLISKTFIITGQQIDCLFGKINFQLLEISYPEL
jgi:hypothetical protein